MKVLECLMLYILSRLIYNVSEKEGIKRGGGEGRRQTALCSKHSGMAGAGTWEHGKMGPDWD